MFCSEARLSAVLYERKHSGTNFIKFLRFQNPHHSCKKGFIRSEKFAGAQIAYQALQGIEWVIPEIQYI
jgi:hypothetical protein